MPETEVEGLVDFVRLQVKGHARFPKPRFRGIKGRNEHRAAAILRPKCCHLLADGLASAQGLEKGATLGNVVDHVLVELQSIKDRIGQEIDQVFQVSRVFA